MKPDQTSSIDVSEFEKHTVSLNNTMKSPFNLPPSSSSTRDESQLWIDKNAIARSFGSQIGLQTPSNTGQTTVLTNTNFNTTDRSRLSDIDLNSTPLSHTLNLNDYNVGNTQEESGANLRNQYPKIDPEENDRDKSGLEETHITDILSFLNA